MSTAGCSRQARERYKAQKGLLEIQQLDRWHAERAAQMTVQRMTRRLRATANLQRLSRRLRANTNLQRCVCDWTARERQYVLYKVRDIRITIATLSGGNLDVTVASTARISAVRAAILRTSATYKDGTRLELFVSGREEALADADLVLPLIRGQAPHVLYMLPATPFSFARVHTDIAIDSETVSPSENGADVEVFRATMRQRACVDKRVWHRRLAVLGPPVARGKTACATCASEPCRGTRTLARTTPTPQTRASSCTWNPGRCAAAATSVVGLLGHT
jgi:hypothetical protein